jgi:hypothetical protein
MTNFPAGTIVKHKLTKERLIILPKVDSACASNLVSVRRENFETVLIYLEELEEL